MRKMFAFLAATAALTIATPAAAAVTLQTNAAGKLTGATGVDIGGTLFDVTFLTGSCITNFTGCDAASDFQFSSFAEAQIAAQALLDQVFIGAYDVDPARIVGCASMTFCDVFQPYGTPTGLGTDQFTFHAALASNIAGIDGGSDVVVDYSMSPAVNQSGTIFARFTPSSVTAAVPEPATWAMMLLGFGGIGLAVRRKRTPALAQIA